MGSFGLSQGVAVLKPATFFSFDIVVGLSQGVAVLEPASSSFDMGFFGLSHSWFAPPGVFTNVLMIFFFQTLCKEKTSH
jgi:hypothetical protein